MLDMLKHLKIFILIYFTFVVFISIIYFVNKYTSNKKLFNIDVVYTWAGELKTEDNRTRFNNELMYSIRSVLKNMPWINKIFILMNPPLKFPSWLDKEKCNNKIIVLDHTQLDEDNIKFAQPNTNSYSIETMISNIPGLSEHFIYMNDDFFITNKISPSKFFTPSGLPKIPRFYGHNKNLKKLESTKHKFDMPYQHNLKLYTHIPNPILKSELKKFIEVYKYWIELGRSKTFRNGVGCDDCIEEGMNNCPCFYLIPALYKYMYDNKKASTELSYSTIYINLDTIDKLKTVGVSNFTDFMCINDHGDSSGIKEMKNGLERLFGDNNYLEK